jgi:hypothetical protein
MNKVEN